MIRKEIDEALARLHSAQQAEEARKRAQQEVIQNEINQLYRECEERSEFLKRAAKDFLSPLVTAVGQTGFLEVLGELQNETGITREPSIFSELTYSWGSSREYQTQKITFHGLSLDCEDWRMLGKHEDKYSGPDLVREGLKNHLARLNSVKVENSFSTTGLSVDLSWEALKQSIPNIQYRFGRPYLNPVQYPPIERILYHYIEGYFLGRDTNVFFIVDRTSGWAGDRDERHYGEKVTFLRQKWEDRALLRKIVAEAYARRVSWLEKHS